MNKYTLQLIAYSKPISLLAENTEEAIEKLHLDYGLADIEKEKMGELLLSIEPVKNLESNIEMANTKYSLVDTVMVHKKAKTVELANRILNTVLNMVEDYSRDILTKDEVHAFYELFEATEAFYRIRDSIEEEIEKT